MRIIRNEANKKRSSEVNNKRVAYEWSVLSYVGGIENSYDADPVFSDDLKSLGLETLNRFVKSKTFTGAKLISKDSDNNNDVYGDLEIKIWKFINDEWDFDYARVDDNGTIQKSTWYNWKVPNKYQVELNQCIKRS
jgi:hypothetical protein